MRPIFACLGQIFKRKCKNKNKGNNKMYSTTTINTTTGGGGGHNPHNTRGQSYNRGETWPSWPPVLPPSSSSEGEEVEGQQQGRESLGQAGCCAANNNHRLSQAVPITIEAWWMDPALKMADENHRRRRGRVVQGEGVWW